MTGKAARSASAVMAAATGNLWTRFLKRLPLRPFNWNNTSSELLSDAASASTASSRRTSVSDSDSDFSSDIDSDASLPEFAPYSEEEDEYFDDDPTPRIASVSCFETHRHSIFGLNHNYPDLAVDVEDVFAFCVPGNTTSDEKVAMDRPQSSHGAQFAQFTTGEADDDFQLSASLFGEPFNKAVAAAPGILSVRDGAKFFDDGYEEDLRRRKSTRGT